MSKQATMLQELPPQVMQDKGAWQFTDEQIAQIKKHDAKAMTEFYNANYEIFLGMARKFVWKKKHICNHWLFTVEDCLQQVFVDLPYYNFSSRCSLYFSIVKGTFLKANDGGITVSYSKYVSPSLMFSYDKSINGTDDNASGSYILDKLITAPSADMVMAIKESNEDRELKDKKIIAYLERTIKNKRDLNVMFCKLFTDLPLSQIRGDEYAYYKQCEI